MAGNKEKKYSENTNKPATTSDSTHDPNNIIIIYSSVGVANRLGNPDCTKISFVCAMYETAVRTLSQLRLEILTGKFACNFIGCTLQKNYLLKTFALLLVYVVILVLVVWYTFPFFERRDFLKKTFDFFNY